MQPRHKDLGNARVAVYARFSSERQSETSIDDQVERCRQYIAQIGGDPARATVFSDFAISGASLERPGFEALMTAVESKRVDVIVTEDISRISRDFADAASVFKRLQYAKVPLIGIADGIDTSTRDAKLSFTLKSLVADIYLDDLRDKTLRGLEGRARAGYATGGLPLGYRSVEDRDRDGRTRGHTIEINDDGAALVRRIFELYRDGQSLSAIARTLNKDGIPSPRTRTRHKRSGWGASTIRAILYNERYAGVWAYKEQQWVKVPGTNKRRPQARPASEVMRFERPDLRIIEPALWDAVHSRLSATYRRYTRNANGAPKGRAVRPPRKSPYLLSSLLYCGTCDAPMTITGGSSASYYRCADERKKGTCRNALSIREEVARTGILAHLRRTLLDRATIAHVRQQFARQLGDQARTYRTEFDERQQRLARTESRIQGLIDFIADGDRSEYVVATLRDLEAQARAEKAALADLQARASSPVRLPSLAEITEAIHTLDTHLTGDLEAAREFLRRLFHEGRIHLDPIGDAYTARGKLQPLVLLAERNCNRKSRKRDFSNEIALFDGCSGDTRGRLDHALSCGLGNIRKNQIVRCSW